MSRVGRDAQAASETWLSVWERDSRNSFPSPRLEPALAYAS